MTVPIHPGSHLAEFLEEYEISQYRLAKDIAVSPRRINEIVKEQRAISADTAVRLGLYFGTTAAFWMNLQANYDLALVEHQHGAEISKEVRPRAA